MISWNVRRQPTLHRLAKPVMRVDGRRGCQPRLWRDVNALTAHVCRQGNPLVQGPHEVAAIDDGAPRAVQASSRVQRRADALRVATGHANARGRCALAHAS